MTPNRLLEPRDIDPAITRYIVIHERAPYVNLLVVRASERRQGPKRQTGRETATCPGGHGAVRKAHVHRTKPLAVLDVLYASVVASTERWAGARGEVHAVVGG